VARRPAAVRDALEDASKLVQAHAAGALGQTSDGDEKSDRNQVQNDPHRVLGE
jgi:HEAT repeat protein